MNNWQLQNSGQKYEIENYKAGSIMILRLRFIIHLLYLFISLFIETMEISELRQLSSPDYFSAFRRHAGFYLAFNLRGKSIFSRISVNIPVGISMS